MQTSNRWFIRHGAAVLCSLGLPMAALAAPPAETERPLHLDLRAPSVSELAGLKASIVQPLRPALRAEVDSPVEQYASGLQQPRLIGSAQTLLQRFGHEGLPIARLWENQTALLSLGLSPRGKPGLWLVQKTR